MSDRNRLPHILVGDELPEEALTLLRTFGEVDLQPHLTEAELSRIISLYDALIVRGRTEITADIIARGTNLRVIGRVGTGLENIDVLAAKERHVLVVNTPGVHTLAVAEHTLGLMLAVARHLPQAQQGLRKGEWDRSALMGTGLAGKTLGIVGFGRIGREVARRAQAFGMRILVNQRRPTPELDMEGIESVDLMALLGRSDFVSIHVPLREETAGLISREELARMKPGAYLINTARSEVVDNEALLAALNDGQLAGAALDVYLTEQVEQAALIQHPKVIATPHIGARTEDATLQAALGVVEQIGDILQGIEINNILPLRIVPMTMIFPHEGIDPRRVERLAGRLETEGKLGNPPIVTEVEGKFMILDGATRVAAMKKLGYPHAVVQISSPESGLDLHTWYHVIRRIDEKELVDLLDGLPEISLVPVEADKADDDMFAYGALCYLIMSSGQAFLVQPSVGVNRLDALNHLTETYIGAAYVDRTLEKDMRLLRSEYPDLAALVVFPEYTVDQVMQVTLSGRYFPAGITRFVIPGRILRLNADLSVLKADQPLHEKNRWLNQLLEEKVRQNRIRFYREPVYLLDE